MTIWPTVKPAATTTYTLTATSPYGTATSRCTVTVNLAPSITTFTASPNSINRGQSVTLNWTTSGEGVSLSLNNGVGIVEGTSCAVQPTATTTYTLTATNPSGAVSSTSTTITVNQPPTFGALSLPVFSQGQSISAVLPAANDPDGISAYEVVGLPSGLSFLPATRTVSGTVAKPGGYPFVYTATDAKGAATSIIGTLTIQAAGTVPTAGFATTIGYAYDPQGRLSALTYPSGHIVNYTYDDLNRVTKVAYRGEDVISQIIYDDWGNPSSRQFQSGARDEWTYDALGTQMTQWAIGTTDQNSVPSVRAYSYDKADRLTKAGEWTSLEYDVNSRLTKAVGFDLTNSLAHDAFNNNTYSVTTSAGEVPSTMNNFTFDPLPTNHLPSLAKNGGLVGVIENNFGEITSIARGVSSEHYLTMTWDNLGRMSSTVDEYNNGAVESYQYTASGLRIIRTDSLDGGRNEYYAYTSGGNLLADYGFESTQIWGSSEIIYLGDEAIAQVYDQIYAYHNDHQGTPRVFTGSDGTVAGGQVYGPYGERNDGTEFCPLIGYTGHLQTEPTGLIYMRGRFYSPAWHRFMNSNQGVDPNLINQFAYTIGSPLDMTDPSGYDAGGRRPDRGDSLGSGYEKDSKMTDHGGNGWDGGSGGGGIATNAPLAQPPPSIEDWRNWFMTDMAYALVNKSKMATYGDTLNPANPDNIFNEPTPDADTDEGAQAIAEKAKQNSAIQAGADMAPEALQPTGGPSFNPKDIAKGIGKDVVKTGGKSGYLNGIRESYRRRPGDRNDPDRWPF